MGSTMMMVWFMTPSFLAAGIDIKFHGLLFAAISIIAIGGSELVGNNRKIHPTTPLLVAAVAYFTLGWQISLATVLIFLLTSFARGINTARVKPYIQEVVPDDIQATAISVYGMLYRVVSSCLVLTVNYIGNFKLSFGLIASGLICIAMWLVFRLNQAKYV
jgi:type IV secretory pathway TrbD component